MATGKWWEMDVVATKDPNARWEYETQLPINSVGDWEMELPFLVSPGCWGMQFLPTSRGHTSTTSPGQVLGASSSREFAPAQE